MVLAFSHPVWTPARSDRGWTRGMPPPHRSPVRTANHVRATLSEQAPPTPPVSAPPAPPSTEDETVNAYVTRPPQTSPTSIDKLVAELGHDPRSGTSPLNSLIANPSDQTVSVHAGERVRTPLNLKAMLDAIHTPIVQSATFTFRSTKDCIEYNRGTYQSYEYARYGNPTTRAVEEKVMALDHAEDCVLSSSGMCAVTTMLLALIPENGHIVVTTDCYRRTRQFITTVLPKMGIDCTVLDPADMDGLRRVLETRGADMYFSESPTNPLIRVVDVAEISRICRPHGTVSVIDTTFATPVNFRPIDFGADLVLHSATKYLSGHQDVLCGALAGRADLVKKVKGMLGVMGGVVDPHVSFLVSRGMKTLGVRMEAHNRNAAAVAEFLSKHPKVGKVHYPTLESHVDYEVASKLFQKGFGGVLSFELRGNGDKWSRETFEATGRFVDGLKIPYIGPSLGGCESLVEQVCIMGYFDQPLKERKRLGINNGLVRYSCGIEDTHDLVDDIEQALRFV